MYRNLVLKVPLTEGVFVRAVEFRTNGAPIHHAVIRVDRTSASRRHDGEDGQPGFDGMSFSVTDPDGQFIGWAPGRGPIVSPEGMAWRLERGSDLVVELHVIDSKEATPLKPSVGLFLTKTPPRQRPITVRMASKAIDIPAGKADYVVTDDYELPANVTVLSVYPHAHYLGREMRTTATLPDGSVKTLLHIPHWNFHWQQDYRYVTPIRLPRGTRLSMRYTFDNSAGNPHNPNKPPIKVQGGPRAVDEMAEFSLQLLTESASDALRLLQDFDRKDKLANVALGEIRTRDKPDDAEVRDSSAEPTSRWDDSPRASRTWRPRCGSATNRRAPTIIWVRRRCRWAGCPRPWRTFAVPSRPRLVTRSCTSTSAPRSAR